MMADLHIHSDFSDGTQSIPEIIQLSLTCKLKVISITDHDTIDGLSPSFDYIQQHQIPMDLISGVELSTQYLDLDLHILGYLFDYSDQQFVDMLNYYKNKREIRAEKIVDKLNQLGYPLDIMKVKKTANNGSIGRPHIARSLVDHGYMPSVDYAFDRYLGYYKPAYVPKEKLTPEKAIEMIHQTGGIAILAHPGSYINERILKELLSYSLDGIEVYHPNHTQDTTMKLLKMAKNYNILITGGSDHHGSAKTDTFIGKIKLPYIYYEKLQDFYQQKKMKYK